MINRFVSFVVDAVLVTIFVVMGMASHSSPWGEFLATAWPFWLGLVIGWFAWVLLKPDLKATSLPVGLIVWVSTVAIGLTARILSGGTATGAFPYITLGVTALFLLGWRLVYVIANRSRREKAVSRDRQQKTNGVSPDRLAPSKAEDKARLARHTQVPTKRDDVRHEDARHGEKLAEKPTDRPILKKQEPSDDLPDFLK